MLEKNTLPKKKVVLASIRREAWVCFLDHASSGPLNHYQSLQPVSRTILVPIIFIYIIHQLKVLEMK